MKPDCSRKSAALRQHEIGGHPIHVGSDGWPSPPSVELAQLRGYGFGCTGSFASPGQQRYSWDFSSRLIFFLSSSFSSCMCSSSRSSFFSSSDSQMLQSSRQPLTSNPGIGSAICFSHETALTNSALGEIVMTASASKLPSPVPQNKGPTSLRLLLKCLI